MSPRFPDDPAYAALETTVQDMVAARRERDAANERLRSFELWAAQAWTLLNSNLTHPAMEQKIADLLAEYPASQPPGYFRAPGQPWPRTPNKETP